MLHAGSAYSYSILVAVLYTAIRQEFIEVTSTTVYGSGKLYTGIRHTVETTTYTCMVIMLHAGSTYASFLSPALQ